MYPLKRSHVGKRLSQVAEYNGLLFLAGQVASDVTRGMAGQTQEVLSKVDRLLAEHGSDKTRILSCQIFISDISLFSEMNETWDQWVDPEHTPPRATVEARLAAPDKLIEVVVIAARR
ncbi:RidA family protein [Paraburkholderia jirisanensis]